MGLPATQRITATTDKALLAGGPESNRIEIWVNSDGRTYVIDSIYPLEVGGSVCEHPSGNPNQLICQAPQVSAFEFNADGGKVWFGCKLLDEPKPLTWVRWEIIWNQPKPGPARLMVRATDKEGRTQPTERNADRRSYMINHIVPVDVTVR